MKSHDRPLASAFCLGLLAVAATATAEPLGSAFTYQGQLKSAGVPVNGSVDLVFTLWDDPFDASPFHQIGFESLWPGTAVSGGVFTVTLDFGYGAFDGNARWLQIEVNGATLTPRQLLTATPFALYAAAIPLDGSGFSGYAARSDHHHDADYFRRFVAMQFTGTLSPGQTGTWFTFGYPPSWNVEWFIRPTTAGGKVRASIETELSGDSNYTYWITVTNTGPISTNFEAKYVVLADF